MAPSGSLKLESPNSFFVSGESTDGTPDTKLTSFSPEGSKAGKPQGHYNARASCASDNNDPFISNTPVPANGQKLSANASAFLPYGCKLGSVANTPCATAGSGTTLSIADMNHLLEDGPAASAVNTGFIPQAIPDSFGTFSMDGGATRCLKVTSIYNNDLPAMIEATLTKLTHMGFPFKGNRHFVPIGNVVYLRLFNITDAFKMYSIIRQQHTHCVVEYITPVAFDQVTQTSSTSLQTNYEAQVMITAKCSAFSSLERKHFENALLNLLSTDGPLFAWQKLFTPDSGVFTLVSEYEDIEVAHRTIHRCNGKIIEGAILAVNLYTPDIDLTRQMYHATKKPANSDTFGGVRGGMEAGKPQRSFTSANLHTSGTPLSINSMGKQQIMPRTGHSGFGGGITSSALPVSSPAQSIYNPSHRDRKFEHSLSPSASHASFLRSQNYSHDSNNNLGYSQSSQSLNDIGQGAGKRNQANWRTQHSRSDRRRRTNSNNNYVDIDKIRQGIDVRTTVMLRNIPNKVDQPTLKRIVDESSHGLYDFMYLRIDFSNDCNVGYAFINFTDPLDIIKFVEMRANKRWHCFKSDKIAEVSYATIQGKDCLVQKFRNSSVMLEPEHCRPKLYYSHGDPRGPAGEEEEFPTVDNPSKLKRSCENAEHIGLFAPSAGHQLRDEQRRRQSQYDRGTSLAEREEYFGDEWDDHRYEQPDSGASLEVTH
ncbi:RNA recognition motif 2-domain-containing protein [Xylogone sp. PMI_703]|nr:RNA recognition motif 2-domain-containing protein [Xylogone sp. PMI_703]